MTPPTKNIEALARQVRHLSREIAELRATKMVQHPEELSLLKTHALRIINTVCKTYGILLEDMLSRRRTGTIAEARQVAMALCRETTNMTSTEIGEIFGRDHGDVLHACRVIAGYRDVHPKFAAEYKRLLTDLTPSPRETYPNCKTKQPRLILLAPAA